MIATPGFGFYQWYYFATLIGVGTSSILATQDGDYTLLVTNSFGCQSSVSLLNVVTGISNVFADGSTVSVFPNPSNGSFRVQYLSKTNSVVDVQLLNSVGQLVYSDQFNPVSEKSTLDINGISAGVYSLKLSTQNGSVIRKVLVQ
ncbi:MAG: T9SS type A sorting domain-containing protein [Bacteroidetes bacterium]|nr:T9SS type A sorting domain-containing protein [Bacteroidota bacterium]